ncbi:helix-turn-helix domain-containing protein [Mycolicibacterium sp. CBMA 361]|uniref:PucR family transcriptional regulator n=1 Tax=Mycolicibacterium sp. CBMA 361 TaxID=2606610 RepID=UPI0012DEAEFD|nr:helix-turn-helix domain-containing protein [Mycolicibacterium sp. CBMA 361]MUM34794.1 PucR family transcriptional regulator [Mycolicibacterium sp. CBMA 361]
MANAGPVDDTDIARLVEVTADRLRERSSEVSAYITSSLEADIPELRSDARLIDLLGGSVEGNVDTLLHAVRYGIPVQRVEAPTMALEYARRMSQQGVSVNALVRAYRVGQRRMNEHVFREVRGLDIPPGQRVAVLESITTTLFEYIDWVTQQVVAVYDDVVTAVGAFARRQSGAPSIAIGPVAAGLDGFRRTHHTAIAVRGVAVVTGRPELTVVCATEPGLEAAALLAADVDAARQWAGAVLGELAADTDNDGRLRETLRVFLRCGSSHKQAAEELNLHFNTVKYRVGKAIERRGRPIADDRLDVELALLVCKWYGVAATADLA